MLQQLQINDLLGQPLAHPIYLHYEVVGQPLYTAPIVLINHALTGNSNVAGTNGWWKTLVGPEKTIDTQKYTILSFNIPGNGYNSPILHESQQPKSIQEVASIFLSGLQKLNIEKLHAIIGGSIGGAIAWEMLSQQPNICKILIPIASDYKTRDWLHGHCLIQKFLLENPENGLEKARMHAMLCYRSPQSINDRFQNKKSEGQEIPQSEAWLHYHGNALKNRFHIESYRLMNHLLSTIAVDLQPIETSDAEIHLIAVDQDLFFPAKEIQETYQQYKNRIKNIHYHEISSEHGHDAFLIEYEQLNKILNPILNYHEQQYHYHLQQQSAY